MTEFLIREGEYVVRYDETVYLALYLWAEQVIDLHRPYFEGGIHRRLGVAEGCLYAGQYLNIRG